MATELPTNSVTLTGSGTDEDGTIVAYLWSLVSGPNIPGIQSPGSAVTVISGLIEGTYVFQLMVTDDDGATAVDTVTVTVTPSPIKTISLQPGPGDGYDLYVFGTQNCTPGVPYENAGNENQFNVDQLLAFTWTLDSFGWSTGKCRSLIRFQGLSSIPKNSTIISAKLSLYGVSSSTYVPQGNSYYPGSSYNSYGTNECWVKRITSDWSQNTVTWNNQPSITETDRVVIPQSSAQWNYNVTDVDVTSLVKAMVNNANANFGFLIMHQVEDIYRSMVFGSADNADPTKRPKLEVVYQ